MKLDLSSFSFVELKKRSIYGKEGQHECGSLSSIITPTHRQQQDIYAESFCESQRYRNRTPLARQIWILLVDDLWKTSKSIRSPT